MQSSTNVRLHTKEANVAALVHAGIDARTLNSEGHAANSDTPAAQLAQWSTLDTDARLVAGGSAHASARLKERLSDNRGNNNPAGLIN